MIYYVQCKDARGPIKIGYSAYANVRIENLQRHIPYDLCTLNVTHGTEQHEKTIHRLFKPLHIRNEWFHAVPPLLEFIEHAEDHMPDIIDLCKSGPFYTIEELAIELGKNPRDIVKWIDTSRRCYKAVNGLTSFERAGFAVFFKEYVKAWKFLNAKSPNHN